MTTPKYTKRTNIQQSYQSSYQKLNAKRIHKNSRLEKQEENDKIQP
jgi:hypothetical protein